MLYERLLHSLYTTNGDNLFALYYFVDKCVVLILSFFILPVLKRLLELCIPSPTCTYVLSFRDPLEKTFFAWRFILNQNVSF